MTPPQAALLCALAVAASCVDAAAEHVEPVAPTTPPEVAAGPVAVALDGLSAPVAAALREAHRVAERDAAAAADAPGRARAWGRLGMFYHAQHLPWAAEAAYTRAVAEDDGGRWRYLRAIVREERGQLAAAIADYAAVTRAAPDNVAAWYRLGAGLLVAGDHDGAEQALDAALRRDPKAAVALLAKADAQAARGNWGAARGLYERAWALQPDAGQVAYKLAMAARALGDAEGARRWLARRGGNNAKPKMDDPLLLEVAELSLSPRFFVKAGEWALERGDLDQAIAALETALTLAADAVDIRLTYARLLVMAGRPAAALAQVRNTVETAPDAPRAWYQLAWLLRFATAPAEAAEAEAAVRRSLALEGDLAARTLAAALAMRRGDFGQAMDDYAAARDAAPDSAYFHYWLGLARLASGDCAGRAALREALRLRAAWGEAHIALARADALCGSAKAALRRARGLLAVKDDVDTRLTLAFAELASGTDAAAAARVAAHGDHPDATMLRDAQRRGSLPERPFAAGSPWWLPPELRRERPADGG